MNTSVFQLLISETYQLPSLGGILTSSPLHDFESYNLSHVSLHLPSSSHSLYHAHGRAILRTGQTASASFWLASSPFRPPVVCIILLEVMITLPKLGSLPLQRKEEPASCLTSLLLSLLCLPHHVIQFSCFSLRGTWPFLPVLMYSLCCENSSKLPPPSDSQLLLEIFAHVPPFSAKSFGICRECHQQPFPIPSQCFRDYSCFLGSVFSV